MAKCVAVAAVARQTSPAVTLVLPHLHCRLHQNTLYLALYVYPNIVHLSLCIKNYLFKFCFFFSSFLHKARGICRLY